jgi:hypothetical protein
MDGEKGQRLNGSRAFGHTERQRREDREETENENRKSAVQMCGAGADCTATKQNCNASQYDESARDTQFPHASIVALRVYTWCPGACLRKFWLFAFIVASTHVVCAQNTPICGPSAEIQGSLDRIPAQRTADQSDYNFRQSRRTGIRALLQRYPTDVFVQRAYIDDMSNADTPSDRTKVIEEYRVLHDRRPDDGAVSYLYGITLLGGDTPEAIQLFTAALAKSPDFPWPHLQFVAIYSTPNFLDKAQAVSHAKAFLSACPSALEAYSAIHGLGDADLIRQAAPQLRRALQPRRDREALAAYPTLWQLEFAARPPSEYDALRKQVAGDVAHLRTLNLESVQQWWRALQEGYKLANDEPKSTLAALESARRFPSNSNLPERTQWYESHAYPGADAPSEKRKAYYRDLLKQTDTWTKQHPTAYPVWFDRLQALETLDDAPAADVESCVAKLRSIAQAEKGPAPLDAVTDYQLLLALYNKKLLPSLQLELAQKALEQRDAELQRPPDDRYSSKRMIDANTFGRPFWRFSALFYQVDAHVRLKQAGKAQDALAQADAALRALKPQINGKDDLRKSYAGQESLYFLAEARLAELQGHKIDAMAYYQSALLARLDSGSFPAPGEKDDVAGEAHQLWASLGGTDESWKLWYTRRADALAAQRQLTWETVNEALPPFQLTDLQGKTWQPADLRGKVAFLNFWASY